MSLLNPVANGRIQTPDGIEYDLSAIWDIHVMVSESEDLIYLRLSDAHADEALAAIYTTAIEAGSGLELTTTAPIAAGTFQSGPWHPLEDGHFRFGLAADCLRLSALRITDRNGLIATLAGALSRFKLDKQNLTVAVLGRDSRNCLVAHVVGKTRSAMPQHTIDPGAGHRGQSLQGGLAALAGQLTGGNPPIPTPTPVLPATPVAPPAPTRPRGRSQSAGKSPAATPFKPGSRPFKGPLKKWF